MREPRRLQVGDQRAPSTSSSTASQPGAQQRARVVRPEVAAVAARSARRPRPSRARRSAAPRPGRAARPSSPRPSARTASAIAACAHLAAEPWSPNAPTRPARTWARNSSGVAAERRLRPRAPDVDAGVVVGAADAGAAVRVDVDRGRQVELARRARRCGPPRSGTARRAGAGGARSAARRRRRTGARARTRSRARAGTRRRSRRRRRAPAATRGASGVIPRHSTCTACGSPRKRAVSSSDTNTSGSVGDLEDAGDRVVVGDRHEVHAPRAWPARGPPPAAWRTRAGPARAGHPACDTAEADEWQCRSARLMGRRMARKRTEFVKASVPRREGVVNGEQGDTPPCSPVRLVPAAQRRRWR